MLLKTITKWKLIELAHCIVESHLTGTTKIDMLISPSQDKSKNNSKNMSTFGKDHLKIAHTQHQPKIMEKPSKIPLVKILPKIIKRQETISPTGGGQHTVQCQGCQHHTRMALSTIDAEQPKATEFTIDTVKRLLDYCTKYPNAKIRYKNLIQIFISTLMPCTLVHPKLKVVGQDTCS